MNRVNPVYLIQNERIVRILSKKVHPLQKDLPPKKLPPLKGNKPMYKYESDLTPKEKRQLEIEKIKSLPPKDKLEHMWAYHKLILFLPIILVALVIFTYQFIQNVRTETVLRIAVVDSTRADVENVIEELRKQLNVHNRFSEISIDTNYFTSDGEFDMQSIQKFTVIVAAGGMDVLISSSGIYDFYIDAGLFLDLNHVFTAEELTEMNVIDSYAIDITDSSIAREVLRLYYSPIYFMVIGNAEVDEINHDGMTKRELIRGFFEFVN